MYKWKCRLLKKVVIVAWNICIAQTSTYNDVVVLINQNSEVSERIGTYFAAKRNIPPQNIIRVLTPVQEEIDSVTFEQLREQVETALTICNLKDSINYIVTTKGMPLKVQRQIATASSSVESELMLILGPYASLIGKNGRVISPYYRKATDFTRSQYGIYLVTRLDGYTETDIINLIDKTSAIPPSIPPIHLFVFDQDPTWNPLLTYLNNYMNQAAEQLQNRRMNVLLDSETTFVTSKTHVLGYASWGSNDRNQHLYTTNAQPHFEWLPGAIAETYVSTSARTFTAPAIYGQSLIADLIAEGVSGAKGYVYEPYASAMSDVSVLFPMYVDGYTLAEAFFSATPSISWMDVVVGDPKFRLIPTRLPYYSHNDEEGTKDILPVELAMFTADVNPTGVLLHWKTITENNCYGFEIVRTEKNTENSNVVAFVHGAGNSNVPLEYFYVDENVPQGTYEYTLRQIDSDGSLHIVGKTEVRVNYSVSVLGVTSYPNPFNPSTTITVSLPHRGMSTVKIYNAVGQLLQTLFEGFIEGSCIKSFRFNGENLSSGVYFCIVQNAIERSAHRLLLLR